MRTLLPSDDNHFELAIIATWREIGLVVVVVLREEERKSAASHAARRHPDFTTHPRIPFVAARDDEHRAIAIITAS